MEYNKLISNRQKIQKNKLISLLHYKGGVKESIKRVLLESMRDRK